MANRVSDDPAQPDPEPGPRRPAGRGRRSRPTDTPEEIRAYIDRLMATRPEPTPTQIQTVRDLLPPPVEHDPPAHAA